MEKMPRHAKKEIQQSENEAVPQGVPHPESMEDRLVRTGLAMDLARDSLGDDPRKLIELVEEQGVFADLGLLSQEARPRFALLGKQDPRPFIQRLKQLCSKLLERLQSQENEKRLVEKMQFTLSDLEVVLAVRRYGGRPKGTR